MLTEKIPVGEITFHHLSERDTNGRVFNWKGQIYRGLTARSTPFYLDLFERGIIPQLIAQNLLIETEITPLQVEKFALILKHRLIPFVSYPREWCDLMLKDAALLHLDLCWELARHDLVTKDAYPLNILFDGVKPIFVDLCSIELAANYPLWTEYDEFYNLFVNPLHLMRQGKGRIARWLLHDLELGVLTQDVRALTRDSTSASGILVRRLASSTLAAKSYLPHKLLTIARKIQQKTQRVWSSSSNSKGDRLALFERIRQEVAEIELPPLNTVSFNSSSSTHSDRDRHNSIEPFDEHKSVDRAVNNILAELKPQSTLNLDSDRQGIYSLMAVNHSKRVVSFHTDDLSARQLYLEAKTKNLSILPLLMDFNSPNCGLSNEWYSPANERLQCELALALNLVEKLVFKNKLDFDRIVTRLAKFSQRWLVVEFVPRVDRDLVHYGWYRLDYFMEILNKHFRRVDIVVSTPDFQLLLCEKMGEI